MYTLYKLDKSVLCVQTRLFCLFCTNIKQQNNIYAKTFFSFFDAVVPEINLISSFPFCIVSIFKNMQSKISPVEAIVNAAILDSALERFCFFSVGEGIPKRHRLGYQKTKTPCHEPYMGIYVSGTPVRGGDREMYLQRLRWLHSEDQGRRHARNTLFTDQIGEAYIFFLLYGFINAHFE